MTTAYRFTLLIGSKKFLCPSCGKKRFVPYVDTHNGELLPEKYGRCDRAINCTYHVNPYDDGYSKFINDQESDNSNISKLGQALIRKPPVSATPTPEPSFIPVEILKQSRTGYNQNNFVIWLTSLFDTETVNNLISRYHIGTSKHQFANKDFPGYQSPPGATVFWQIDQLGKIRGGKIMLYNSSTGKREKEPFNHITWTHTVLKLWGFRLEQCLFGEHLLKAEPTKPVALVESEKTAIVASVYLPEFLWLAVGSLSNLKKEKCQVLAGRNVILYPDLNGFEKWSAKVKEFFGQMPGTLFLISDLLEQNATEAERAKGLDLADYLTRFDYRNFIDLQTDNGANATSPPPSCVTGEKGEKSEGSKTNNFLSNQAEAVFSPLPVDNTVTLTQLQKEYYRYTYPELCQEIGLEKAKVTVQRYQELSEQNATLKNWFIHHCPLLISYGVNNL